MDNTQLLKDWTAADLAQRGPEARRLIAKSKALLAAATRQQAEHGKIDPDLDAEIEQAERELREIQQQQPIVKPTGEQRTLRRGSDFEIFKPGEEVRSWTGGGKQDDPETIGEYVVAKLKGDKRAASMGLDTAGGFLFSPGVSGRFIDKVRNASVLGRLCPTIVFKQTDADTMTFVTQTGDATAYWRPELVEITESQPTFGRIDSRPRVIAALCEISEELALRSKNGAELVTNALTNALALEIDRAGLLGTGASSEPTGLVNWPGINTTAFGGSTASYFYISEWANTIERLNGPEMSLQAMISTPLMQHRLRNQVDDNNQFLQLPEEFRKMRKLFTNQLRSNLGGGSATEFILGDFSQMAIINSLDIKVETGHAGDSFKKLSFYVRAWAMVDTAVFRPKFFHHISNVT